MKHGIYYAYWEDMWGADYLPYIEKVAKLGFDFLEIGCAPLNDFSMETLKDLRKAADDNGIFLTAGYGPIAERNLGSADPAIVQNGKNFWFEIFKRFEVLGIKTVGGGLNSYWPVDFSKPFDKAADWARSVVNVRDVAKVAADYGVDFCLEVLNRFEGYMLNTCAEACQFVDEVGLPNVRVMLDTFHMNIEEDDLAEAVRLAGKRLGHFHTGECNRRVPGKGRTPWREIGQALREIGYDGTVCMEPFVKMGGEVGRDIHIWHNMYEDLSIEKLDKDAADAVKFQRYMFDGTM
ncbi:MAG: sugar phosphate isomerase/epimerase [Clostridia bacterium]|nr:sugar phosphate isomerase/epimerase [Clostridia bacterium]